MENNPSNFNFTQVLSALASLIPAAKAVDPARAQQLASIAEQLRTMQSSFAANVQPQAIASMSRSMPQLQGQVQPQPQPQPAMQPIPAGALGTMAENLKKTAFQSRPASNATALQQMAGAIQRDDFEKGFYGDVEKTKKVQQVMQAMSRMGKK